MYTNIKKWSNKVAELSADALIDSGLLEKSKLSKAVEIISEEILVRLSMDDCPLPDILSDWSFIKQKISMGHFAVIGKDNSGNQVSRKGKDTELLMAQAIVDAIEKEQRIKGT